ncbi:uncharacterized protein EI90DRAFT_3137591 [Cantharellus anzutake]|uniref:uncharacterized protein n=1 Tax=Cantharellus anzutake TaxID=1750568 RepID=UPI001907A4FD|nr:uncharacterized protein EI90DRAFT_3137591 [Cantharellus anzutake]KAF8312172.1 hypothetical protein EI90DRAFT_3137591 [Cantharellus anzutake]
MLEIRQEVGANPETLNVPTQDRASRMGVVKGECAEIQAGAETVGMEGDIGKWGDMTNMAGPSTGCRVEDDTTSSDSGDLDLQGPGNVSQTCQIYPRDVDQVTMSEALIVETLAAYVPRCML